MVRKRILRGIGAGAFDKAVILCIQLVLVPVLTLNWGSEVYGQWLMLSAVPALLAFSDFGLATAAGTSMAMEVARGQRGKAAQIYSGTLRIMLVAGTAIVVLAGIVALAFPEKWISPVPGYSAADMRISGTLLAFYGVACLQNSITFAALRSDGKLHVGTLMHTAIYSFEYGAMLAAVLMGGGPVAAAVALAIGRTIGCTAQNILLHRLLPWLADLEGRVNFNHIVALAGPASAAMMIPAAQMLLSQGATVTLGIAAGASTVPVFTAARTLSRIALQATQILSVSVMPEFSAAAGRGEKSLLASLLVLLTTTSLVIVTPFSIALAIWGRDGVLLWTSGALDPPTNMIRAMALGLWLTGFWLPLSSLLVALNRQSVFSYHYLVLAVIAAPLELWLAGLHGATGSALALLAVDAIMVAFILTNLRRMGIGISDLRSGIGLLKTQASALLGLAND